MLPKLRRNERIILSRTSASPESLERRMVTAQQETNDEQIRKAKFFQALDEAELLLHQEVSADVALKIQDLLLQLHLLNSYRYDYDFHRKLGIAIRGLDYPSAGAHRKSLASVAKLAAVKELDQGNIWLAKPLCLVALRAHLGREQSRHRSRKIYETLVLLTAIYIKANDLVRALEIQAMALDLRKSWLALGFEDKPGNTFVIPLLVSQAKQQMSTGNDTEAVNLLKAAIAQADVNDPSAGAFRRTTAMLAKVLVQQGKYAEAVQHVRNLNNDSTLREDSPVEVIQLVVNTYAEAYGLT